MLNKRLLELIPKVFTYTAQAVFFQWLSLLCNIAFTISICRFINYCFYNKTFNSQILIETLGITIVSILLRALFTKININITSRTSQQAKKILREKIFDKLCKIGISYKNVFLEETPRNSIWLSVQGMSAGGWRKKFRLKNTWNQMDGWILRKGGIFHARLVPFLRKKGNLEFNLRV